MGIQRFVNSFRQPGEAYSPCPFWFLNDALRPEELRRQLEDFKAKGVYSVVAHPRIGIPEDMPYLSDAYMDSIACIVETACELNMRVVLYDEGMYPSGCAHGEVVYQNPDFASRALYLTADKEEEGQLLWQFEDGMRLVARLSRGTIRGIHFGEDDGERGAPPSADILNPEATALFIRLTHDRHYERLKEHFGRTIIGFFTDEPCPQGRNARGGQPWTPGFEQTLMAHGVPLPALRGLFEGQEDQHCLSYRRLIRERLNSAYYAQLSDWCARHGIALMGTRSRATTSTSNASFRFRDRI